MMKKAIPVLFLLLSFLLYSGDSSLVDIFIQNFEKGSPEVKYNVLLDASDTGIEGMDSLYHRAILYVLGQIEFLETDDILVRIAEFSINQIHIAGYTGALDDLWELFTKISHTELKVMILAAFGDLGKDDADLIVKMNKWLDSRNVLFLTGKQMELKVIIACIQTLGRIGDPSSFEPVFTAMIQHYSDQVTGAAEQALDMIKGDLSQLYMNVIMEGRMPARKESLIRSIESTRLNDREKCRIAEFALKIALYSSPENQDALIVSLEIRYLAAEFLSKKGWAPAAGLMIEHFDQAIADLDNGRVRKSFLIQAIEGLGNMRSHEAAKRLTLYLEYINSFTENGNTCDEQIVLAVIHALEVIGDRIASKALLYSRYLHYSEAVKAAAQRALRNLK
ncbi:MAG: hypothetical protein JXB88_11925 [Spirochaetales bacterium]|nr:hypothetical protein [Spirochaetales bacterium]